MAGICEQGSGDPKYDGKKMKPASAYDYSKEVNNDKFSDDLKYIIHGEDGWFGSRWLKTIVRDWGKATLSEKADLIFAAGGPLVRIGKYAIPKQSFHRIVKNKILKTARKVGKYEHVVGDNPDIGVEGGKIILKGVEQSFKGKTFNTGLDAEKFLGGF
jgi:hypothetical protein